MARQLREHVAQEVATVRAYTWEVVDATIAEIGAVTAELAKEFDQTIATLDAELAALRAELETLRTRKAARDEHFALANVCL